MSVAGDLLNNWVVTASKLTRSETETNVWAGTFDVTSVPGTVTFYKFVMNDGATWESIDNRSYTIASTNAQTIARAYFNNTGNLGKLTMSVIDGGKATLSWTAGPLIRLQTATESGKGSWEEVPNTLGQGSTIVTISTGQSHFRLVGP